MKRAVGRIHVIQSYLINETIDKGRPRAEFAVFISTTKTHVSFDLRENKLPQIVVCLNQKMDLPNLTH
jgi:hypothetical protein